MNKKIFASAIFVVAAFVSSIASAAITYTNSAAFAGDAQGENAIAAAGGSAVRANNLILIGDTDDDFEADDEIIVRLDPGMNFSGAPTYLVERAGGATATLGLTLKDTSEFGDPTLDDPKITMNDTNGDGLMDRAVVTAAASSTAGDTLTISLNVTAGSGVAVGAGKKARVIVSGNLAVVQEIADVVASLLKPIASSTTLAETDQNAETSVITASATFTVTIPAGTAGGEALTLSPGTDLTWGSAGTTLTWTVHTPGYMVNPLTPSMAVGAASATTSISLDTNWDSSETNSDPIQVVFSASQMNFDGGDVGKRVIALGGIIEGNAQVVDVLENGSEATISSGATIDEIVAGSSVPQALPTIDVTENFDTDLGGSFTITAGDGLSFSGTGTITATGIGADSVTLDGDSKVITVTVTQGNGASDTISITLMGVASSDAPSSLTVEVDSDNDFAEFGPKSDVLTVATVVPLGAVNVSILDTQVQDVGADNYVGTSTISLKEDTYGAISKANETQVNDAFIRFTPSANAEILAIGISDSGYAAGTSPTIGVTPVCEAENAVTTGAWLCEIDAESTAVVKGTSTVSVTVTYQTDEATVGDTVDITLDGNANVEGAVTVANVQISTAASVTGVIPDVATGATTAKTLAKLDIEENFDNAITAGGFFRIVAPSGVAFQDAASVLTGNASIGTPSITATFFPNDTLVVAVALTETLSITPKAVINNSQSGLISFTIYDGDIDGLNGAGVTSEDVVLVHAGELDALEAGDDTSVNAGFSVSNTAAGGLAPYTATSSSDAVATVSVSGTSVSAKGVSVGDATITVKDSLNATVDYDVSVAAGATKTVATKIKGIGGDAGDTSFEAGATTDGGDTYGTEFTATDDVTVIGTVNVNTADQGSDGEIHVLVLSVTDAGSTLATMDADGNFTVWDQTVEGLAAAEVAEPLAASHSVEIFNGNLAVGTHRIALAYSTGSKLIYTGKALVITVTE